MSRTATIAAWPATRPREAADALERLRDWARGVLPDGVAMAFEPPSPALAAQRTLSLHPLSLASNPAPRDQRAPVLQFDLQVLVTAWGPQPLESQQDLADLAFAAMDKPELRLDPDAARALPWQALGLAPRPALLLSLALRRQPVVAVAPRVRQPLMVKTTPMQVLAGVVLGPGDVPVADALVGCPSLARTCRTDHHGRFRLDALPGGPPPGLEVHARGQVQVFAAEALAAMPQPLALRMALS